MACAAVVLAGCSTGAGDVVLDGGSTVDASLHTGHDARATDTGANVHTDIGPSRRDGSVLPGHDGSTGTDVGAVTGTDVGTLMDTGTVTGIDVGTETDAGVVGAMDTAPWTPPDVPALDVMGATLDADTTPHDTNFTVGGATAATAGLFGGSVDPSRAPTVVYPTAGTILPPNLPSFEVHFIPGAGNTQFAVVFAGDRGTVTVYTDCNAVGGGCVTALSTAQFAEVARVAQPGGSVTLTVRGTDPSGTAYGTTAGQTLGVTATVLHGGIYYWAAASGNVLRYDWDLAGAAPEVYLTGDPFNCVGCHVLGRDGRRAAVGRFIPGPAQMSTLDVASRHTLSSTFGGNFASFSPDDLRLLVSDGAHLWVADATTGAVAPGLPGGFVGSMPDWSRDGQHAVFSRPASVPFLFGQPGHNAPADLMVLSWSGTGFGAPTTLVHASGENNYYPAYSPDGGWVLFNRSAASSYDAIDAHLWAVPTDGSHGPVSLAAADGTGDLGNSWPKFAPFAQMYQGQVLVWMTFASKRDYGLRLQQQSAMPANRTAQLWMAAFRIGASPGTDPSAPAFWLPMQDLTTGNHIAQWSEAVLRAGCTTNADCSSTERCQPTNTGMGCVGVTH